MDALQRELGRLEATVAHGDSPSARVIDELSSMRHELASGTDRRPRVQLAQVRVASPCKQSWADMIGDDRVRVCKGCERPVFNLSEMTRDEAEAVLATRGIKPCVRFYRRADGTVKTTDCPTGAPPRRHLAIVATTLLGTSAAMADPAEPAPAPADAPAAATPDPDPEPLMGELVEPPLPAHAAIEWSTWVRASYGVASHAPDVAARAITQPMPVIASFEEAALAADVTMSIANHGRVRLGAWAEVRTSSGPILGGELIADGLPPHPWASGFAGGFVVRAAGNAHLLTTAIGYGYVGSWDRTDAWIHHAAGVRVVAAMTRSFDDPRDWSATLGVELEPIGALSYIVRRVSGD